MTNQFCVPDEACRYILLQRTAYQRIARNRILKTLGAVLPFLSRDRIVQFEARARCEAIKTMYTKDMQAEYLSISDHLPKRCATVLDIGCGVAGIDVLLNRHYSKQDPEFYLLDRTHVERRIFYRFHSKAAFYNSLTVARNLLVANGIPESSVHLLEATDSSDPQIDSQFDLILSLISWGYHYPVNTYLHMADRTLSSNGVLILDIRKGTDGLVTLQQKFSRIETISEQPKYLRVVAAK